MPGFVDLQVNGHAGVDLHTADEAGRAQLDAALAEAGTTAWRPTLITAPEAELTRALGGTWPAACLGVHLEGPFLSPERSGAHPPEHLRAPDLALLRRLLDAGPVTQVTLAPELPGADALDRRTPPPRHPDLSRPQRGAQRSVPDRHAPLQRDGARARGRRARRPPRRRSS